VCQKEFERYHFIFKLQLTRQTKLTQHSVYSVRSRGQPLPVRSFSNLTKASDFFEGEDEERETPRSRPNKARLVVSCRVLSLFCVFQIRNDTPLRESVNGTT